MFAKIPALLIFVPLAYVLLVIETVLGQIRRVHKKIHLDRPTTHIAIFFTISVVISIASLTNPLIRVKERFLASQQSQNDQIQLIAALVVQNDMLHAREQWEKLSPIQKQENEKLFLQLYPSESIKKQIDFWERVLVMQPQSREAEAALAALYHQVQQNEKACEHANNLQRLEPNDSRNIELQKICTQ